MGRTATFKAHFTFVGQVRDSSCREMRWHLGANETPNMGTLLKTRQVTEVHWKWDPSTETHTNDAHAHTQAYNSPSPSPFTLIDCFHPVITSRSHQLHPLTASVSLFTFLFSTKFPFLSSIVHISPSCLRLFSIPLLCSALPQLPFLL